MEHTRQIAAVEQQLAEQRLVVSAATARLVGLEAELRALRAGTAAGRLGDLPRTEAILMVLREADGTLSPTGIVERLRAGGRDDEMRSVTATLSHLASNGLVIRPTRGRYLAT